MKALQILKEQIVEITPIRRRSTLWVLSAIYLNVIFSIMSNEICGKPFSNAEVACVMFIFSTLVMWPRHFPISDDDLLERAKAMVHNSMGLGLMSWAVLWPVAYFGRLQ